MKILHVISSVFATGGGTSEAVSRFRRASREAGEDVTQMDESTFPLFSIVMANYNYGRFLDEAIQSVMMQIGEGKDLVRPDEVEIIIIDGGSTDNSVDVIKKHAKGLPPGVRRDEISIIRRCLPPSPLTYWVSEKDKGQSDAFNKGFAKAKGRFLTWLNADDMLCAGALTAIKRVIIHNERCEWFVGSSVWCDAHMVVERCFCAHRFSNLRAKTGGLTAGGPSSFFTRRLLDYVGGVDENLHYVMDTDLWYKFYIHAHAKYCRTTHLVWAFRQHEASKMSGSGSQRALENHRKSIVESRMMDERYHRLQGLKRNIIDILTISLIDKLRALVNTARYKGKPICEVN